MEINFIDISVFLAFVIAVVTVGIMKSRNCEEVFKNGRGIIVELSSKCLV